MKPLIPSIPKPPYPGIPCRVQETASDIASMIGIFHKLPTLFGTGDEEEDTEAETRPPSLLDEDCKNSVLGVFVRRCVLEYNRLAFSQLMVFHTQWHQYVFPNRPSLSKGTAISSTSTSSNTITSSTSNGLIEDAIRRRDFVSALGHLTLPHRTTRQSRREEDMGEEALTLSSLHGHFGHQ